MGGQKAIAVERSENAKAGNVSATYASQDTCPVSCPLRGAGCYAETSFVGMITRRLNRAPTDDVASIARDEASAIDTLSGTRPMRLHVVGDCPTEESASIVSAAADAYRAKANQPVWAYTHAWRDVGRHHWGGVSVLASCERVDDAWQAMSRGYAAAVVVAKHESDRASMVDGLKVIPCPSQTRGQTCDQCRLCFDADALQARRAVIAFEAHGSGASKTRVALKGASGVVQGAQHE